VTSTADDSAELTLNSSKKFRLTLSHEGTTHCDLSKLRARHTKRHMNEGTAKKGPHSPLLGTLCGDRILPAWHPICVRGGRSQTGIGLDCTVEAGRYSFVTRHCAQERMSQQWRKTVGALEKNLKHTTTRCSLSASAGDVGGTCPSCARRPHSLLSRISTDVVLLDLLRSHFVLRLSVRNGSILPFAYGIRAGIHVGDTNHGVSEKPVSRHVAVHSCCDRVMKSLFFLSSLQFASCVCHFCDGLLPSCCTIAP